MTSPLARSFGFLIAAAVVSAAASSAQAADDVKYEHCFGVAKAGQNDCQTSTHICAGKSTVERDPSGFISLPAGTCAKIGGALSEPAAPAKK